jgi:cytochrome P450 monooxygenase
MNIQLIRSVYLGKWASSLLGPLLTRIVARTQTRLFVGEEVCGNEVWLHVVSSFAQEVFSVSLILRLCCIPNFLRPLLSPCLPGYWRAKRQLKAAQDILVPIITKRRETERYGAQKPDDFLQWMMDLAKTEKEADPANMAHRFLAFMSAPAVATPASSLCHIIYDLITMPDYVEALREEMKESLPHDFRDISLGHLRELKRLDSYMKESQRVNPNFAGRRHPWTWQSCILAMVIRGSNLVDQSHSNVLSRSQ